MLRFRPPIPLGRHDGLKEVKTNGHVCPQHMYYKPDIWIGAEDCLWLNVFTRDTIQLCREILVIVMEKLLKFGTTPASFRC